MINPIGCWVIQGTIVAAKLSGVDKKVSQRGCLDGFEGADRGGDGFRLSVELDGSLGDDAQGTF
jgi:hypothetical protein